MSEPADQRPAAAPGRDDPTAVRTWRPRGVIITAALFTVLFAVGLLLAWLGLPPEVRQAFTPFQIGTLVAILGVLEGVMWLLAGSSVRADATGVTIRNGVRRHRLAWHEVARVRLRPGDPWATAELVAPSAHHDEPRTVMLFGIQGSEGAAARAAVRELNQRLDRRPRRD